MTMVHEHNTFSTVMIKQAKPSGQTYAHRPKTCGTEAGSIVRSGTVRQHFVGGAATHSTAT